MDFQIFCTNMLAVSQCSNFAAFIKLIESNLVHSHRLGEVRHRKSLDTLAHLAAASGCVDILRYFGDSTQYSSLLKKENSDHKTPLHVAAQCGQLECIQYLLSCDIPVDALKRGDWTPLMLSCTKDNADIVKILLKAGANPRLVNKDGWNSLHLACREGHEDIICCLLEHDCLLWKTQSRNGRTPLHTAALHGQINAVKLLLMHADYPADDSDSCGTTPLMDAATANNVPIVKSLIENQKASPNAMDLLGRNALHFASQAGSTDVIVYLIKHCGLEVESKSFRNETPQDFAVKENQMAALQLLMTLKATKESTEFIASHTKS